MLHLFALAVLLLPEVIPTVSPTAGQILAQSKAACGGSVWDRIHSLRVEGVVETGGLSGSIIELKDLTTGRSISRYSLGAFHGASGFDGKMGWNQSSSGYASPNDSPITKQRDRATAYQTVLAYWFPKRWPAKIESLGTRRDDDIMYQVLRIVPRGGVPFELWIEADTHLIARFVDLSDLVPETTYFGDYRTVTGVKIPFMQRTSNGAEQYDTVVRVKNVALNVTVATKDFGIPQQQLNDFSILGGGTEATIPFRLINNHIYIQVRVNGYPLQFLFDTGGASILTRQAAELAGIKSVGAGESIGVGEQSVDTGAAMVQRITLGGKVTLVDQTFLVLSLSGLASVEGVELKGIIGPAILQRFVVSIDYLENTLTFIRRGNFEPVGTAVPFTLQDGKTPQIQGSIDGLTGQFIIDTGSRSALTLSMPFVTSHSLNTNYQTTPKTIIGWGAGGNTKGRVTRGGMLMLGEVPVPNPIVELSAATKGVMADNNIAGNIGGDILKLFTVTFDYATRCMYLKQNKNHNEPMNYDRSGLWINQEGENFVVKALMPRGPADRAGLKVGDVITAVNGKPSSGLSLSESRILLRNGAPGSQVRLVLSKGAHARTVRLVLQRLISATRKY